MHISSVQSLSHVRLFATPWTAACQASLSITNSQSSTQTHVHLVGDAIQPSHPLSSLSLPALNLSQHQGLFQWVSCLHQVAKLPELQLQHRTGTAYWEKLYASFLLIRIPVGVMTLPQYMQPHLNLNSHWWHSVHTPGISSSGHIGLISNGQCLYLIRRLLLSCPGKIGPEVSGNYYFVLPRIL